MNARAESHVTGDRPAGGSAASQPIADAIAQGRRSLSEWDAKSLLAAYGIAVPAGGVARDEGDAVGIARAIEGPVVVKAVGAHLTHKTERGLVALNLEGDDAVRSAARSLLEATAGEDAELLVEQLVRGSREFMIGMKRDPLFGPVVMFGVGGVFAEAYHDVALGVLPLDDNDIEQMLTGIRAKALLGSFRGLPPVNRVALAEAIHALARIAEDHPAVAEIDVNPMIVAGATPIAADALVIVDSGVARDVPVSSGSDVPVPSEPAPALGASPSDLAPVFAPRSVAVIGASADPSKWGGSLLRNLVSGGFAGPIYPVNGRGGTLYDLPAYESIADLPEAPDLALIALGAAHVTEVIRQCGARGVPAALVVAAGFSEAGAEGIAAEAELVKTAREAGVTLIGPNCMGMLAMHQALQAIGFLELHPKPGGLSIISQSGNIGVQLVNRAERRGVGIDKYLTVGNEASTTAIDMLNALADEADTTAVLMYLEGIEDGRRFIDVMRRITPKKPVVVLRGGMTEFGRKAAASHTGAMAAGADVFLAAARQTGCLVRTGPDESFDLAVCLSTLPLPAGRRVAVMTLGGGWGVLAADEVARNNLELAPLEPEVLATLDELLPGYWSRNNPIDLVAAVEPSLAERTLTVLAESPAVDAVVVLGILRSPSTGWTSDSLPDAVVTDGCREALSPSEIGFLECTQRLMEQTGKPIINVPLRPMETATFASAARHNPVILYSPVAAVRALSAMAWYREFVDVHSG